ncbi:MAG: cob(I)yrinic acid a,c-diamide adenosyltransferase [Oscillospiraceae bacterium]|nr:cob(I)yrinic acid a,c-diamide adenosyltransferase [Oscillospiraceae bacterium]
MGLLHIYCGTGKGKTTAALGLAVRAAGAGMKICFVQLMKGKDTAELDILTRIPNMTVLRCDKHYGFTKHMDAAARTAITNCHNQLLSKVFSEPSYDMIILDEFNCAYHAGLLHQTAAEQYILRSGCNAEIILTGRNPAPVFLDAADYISEIQCLRHPYKKGIPARKGIEY